MLKYLSDPAQKKFCVELTWEASLAKIWGVDSQVLCSL